MKALILLSAISAANAYWLMGIENFITTERLDPIVNPGGVAGHVHSVLGGSNFGAEVTTAKLRESQCTSIPIPEDKSNYWFPHLYFQWANGSFTSLTGGAVICQYYLFDDKPGTTTAFPDDLRMLSGNPTYRSLNPNNIEQTAVSFLCLDFNGQTTEHRALPNKACPSGIRAQINFQSCWDGKNLDSPDHKSHVAYRSEGADKGSCKDPKFPVTLPRIFIEVYWGSNQFDQYRSQAKNTTQPFVYSHGDRTGYGYHADFVNGWDKGVLQKAVDGCNCNPYGDPTCCANKGIFRLKKNENCYITKSVDEVVTGTIPRLPGNNPVVEEGPNAVYTKEAVTPGIIKPVYVYTSGKPPATGSVVIPPQTNVVGAPSATSAPVASSSVPVPSAVSSSIAAPPAASSSAIKTASVAPPAASSSAIQTSSVVPPAVSPSVIKTSSVVASVIPTSTVKSSVAVPSVTQIATPPPALTPTAAPQPSPSAVKTVTVTTTVQQPVYKTTTVYKTVTVTQPAQTSIARHHQRQRLNNFHQ